MASVVLEVKGWAFLNYLAFALVCIALLVIGIFRLRNPAAPPDAVVLRPKPRTTDCRPVPCSVTLGSIASFSGAAVAVRRPFCHFPPASRWGRLVSSARIGLRTP